jgi:isopenicillin-N N-acyltransferase like protein
MRGIADGAGRDLLDIVALNVRTEINFGLFSDGCTAMAWHTEQHAWLGQNWDVSGVHITLHMNFCSHIRSG